MISSTTNFYYLVILTLMNSVVTTYCTIRAWGSIISSSIVAIIACSFGMIYINSTEDHTHIKDGRIHKTPMKYYGITGFVVGTSALIGAIVFFIFRNSTLFCAANTVNDIRNIM